MPTSLVVHLDIHPQQFTSFVAIAQAHGARSVEIEKGCLGFQVLLPREEANRVILVETYRDDAALDEHWESAHMAEYLERVGPMISGRQRQVCDLQ